MATNTLLSRHTIYRANHTAVVFQGRRFTNAEFNLRVNRLANAKAQPSFQRNPHLLGINGLAGKISWRSISSQYEDSSRCHCPSRCDICCFCCRGCGGSHFGRVRRKSSTGEGGRMGGGSGGGGMYAEVFAYNLRAALPHRCNLCHH